MKIYCDTNTLPANIRGLEQAAELAAVEELRQGWELVVSNIGHGEIMQTRNVVRRETLRTDYDALAKVQKNERLVRIDSYTDPRTSLNWPVFSNVQNDEICAELVARGLSQGDAEHITQAVCNSCDVFLTLDERTIINPHREWLEQRFPTLKVRKPTELLAELQSGADRAGR